MTTPDLNLDDLMPYSVSFLPRSGQTRLKIPEAQQNHDYIGDERHRLPAGTSMLEVTWDGPEALHIQINKGGTFAEYATVPAGDRQTIRSSGTVKINLDGNSQLRIRISPTPTEDTGGTYSAGLSVYPIPLITP